jgi:hypothetical protein
MTPRVIMLIAMVTCLSMTAEAADETLPLACQGTATETMMEEEKNPEPISMGIIVNFTNSTVQGFGNPDPNEDFPIKITGVNEATIFFQGKRPDNAKAATDRRIEGTIDRVTGDVNATDTLTNLKTSKIAYSTRYSLKCRPTQRIF